MVHDLCLRCGKCCHYVIDNTVKRCRFLVDCLDGTFICRIYSRRIGHRIEGPVICMYRRMSPFDYEGCPYNTDKPLFPSKNNLTPLK